MRKKVTKVKVFYQYNQQIRRKPLKESIFLDCQKQKQINGGVKPFWEKLAKKHGYKSGENLRWAFKNERKSRGMLGKTNNKGTHGGPRVGVVDIETLPGISYHWGLWDQNISVDQIIHDTCFLSWAGKHLNENDMFSDIMTSKEARKRDDKKIALSIWKFLSKCDVVVGHNFYAFDNKIINSSFLMHDLPPLKFVIVDTLKVARQNFRFMSNKLKFINKKLGIKQKTENDGFELWKKCSEGNKESLQTMLDYNIGDIYATEDLFYRIRPYVRNFNVALYNEIDEFQCPVCGSTDLKSEGYYYTPAGKRETMRCQNCQCVSRKKENLLSKDKRKSLLVNSK